MIDISTGISRVDSVKAIAPDPLPAGTTAIRIEPELDPKSYHDGQLIVCWVAAIFPDGKTHCQTFQLVSDGTRKTPPSATIQFGRPIAGARLCGGAMLVGLDAVQLGVRLTSAADRQSLPALRQVPKKPAPIDVKGG